jgi:hypothetical protein
MGKSKKSKAVVGVEASGSSAPTSASSDSSSSAAAAPLAVGLVPAGRYLKTGESSWNLVGAATSTPLLRKDTGGASPTHATAPPGVSPVSEAPGGAVAAVVPAAVRPVSEAAVGAAAGSVGASPERRQVAKDLAKITAPLGPEEEKKEADKAEAKRTIGERFEPKGYSHVICWPVIECGCGLRQKWDKTECSWTDEGTAVHTCVECVMARDDLTKPEALAQIVTGSRNWTEARKRVSKFTHAIQNKQEEFPSMTKRGLRTVVLADLKELWGPMIEILARKARHLLVLNAKHMEHEHIAERVKLAKTPEEAEELMLLLDAAYEEDPLLGFAKHDKVTQAAFQLASTYDDEWISTPSMWFRMWYICGGGTGTAADGWSARCCNILPSKVWDTLHEDPMHPGQRWKCCCGTRFKWKYGTLCEYKLKDNPTLFYMKAEVPDKHVMDSRSVFHEENLKPRSPQELYDMLPIVAPSAKGGVLTCVDPANQIWHIEPALFASLPTFEWYQIFNFLGETLPVFEKEKDKKKRLSWEAWEAEKKAKTMPKTLALAPGVPPPPPGPPPYRAPGSVPVPLSWGSAAASSGW